MAIPVIDIFAGPGGLGEGFCSLLNEEGQRVFKISLSIEKEPDAHNTLTLRSFFRQFEPGRVPLEYYNFIKGILSLEELYKTYPNQAHAAKNEAWLAELGISKNAVSNKEVDKKIKNALDENKNWLLIGGPPCQAYSVVGRVRRKETVLDENKDERVGLYKQYLRILAVHNPAVFVMENVKGLLSAETKESSVFSKILKDLSDPVTTYIADFSQNGTPLVCPGYKIFSIVKEVMDFDGDDNPIFKQKDFVINAEKFGIPQTRHRVIIVGIRRDIDFIPGILTQMEEINISRVLNGLPRLRSGLTKSDDDNEVWKNTIKEIQKRGKLTGIEQEIKDEILRQLDQIKIPHCGTGNNYIPNNNINVNYRADWFLDINLDGVCNHKSTGHMGSDLHRYFFASCFGKVKGFSPKLEDFPPALLPDHGNVKQGVEDKKFSDRFRVQLSNKPSKTITSHISKDGHYYIHPDPTQCRSFTVREAARIQTFPDNYYFCGSTTSQFNQVGNAVPPLLANKIAEIVFPIFQSLQIAETNVQLYLEPINILIANE